MPRSRHSQHEEVLRLHAAGKLSLGEIAGRLGISRDTVASIVRRHRARDGRGPGADAGTADGEAHDELRRVVERILREQPVSTLGSLHEACAAHGHPVSVPTLSRRLRGFGIRKVDGRYAEDPDFFISPGPSMHDNDEDQSDDPWRVYTVAKSRLHPDSFEGLPVPRTPDAARLAMASIILTARDLKPRRVAYPRHVKAYVGLFVRLQSSDKLLVEHSLDEYRAELSSTQMTKESHRLWRWRLLCAVEHSAEGLDSLYRKTGSERGALAFQSVLAGVLTAAALAQGHDDIRSWKKSIEAAGRKLSATRARAGRTRRSAR